MKRLQRLFGVLVVVGYVASGDMAHAATYYVSMTGSNHNPGTLALPFQTINYGVSRIGAGDTLLVRGGIYNEWLPYSSIPTGTNWTTGLVRIAAYPGTNSPGPQSGSVGTPAGWEVVTMKPADTGVTNGGADRILSIGNSSSLQYVEFDGINLDASGGVSAPGGAVHYDVVRIDSGPNTTDHIRLKNLKIVGNNNPGTDVNDRVQFIVNPGLTSGSVGFNEFINLELTGGAQSGIGQDFKAGFYLNTSHNLIDSCYLHDMTGTGIEIYSANLTNPDSNTIRNNVIRHLSDNNNSVRDAGIIIGNGTGNAVYNNVISDIPTTGNPSFGIGLELSATNTLVYNNTVYNIAGNGGIWIGATVGTGNAIRNNIAYNNGGGNYVDESGSTPQVDHNLFATDPLFMNAGANNFQLQATSPARDAGATIPLVTNDILGHSRPQGPGYDVGAYEFLQHPNPVQPAGFQIL